MDIRRIAAEKRYIGFALGSALILIITLKLFTRILSPAQKFNIFGERKKSQKIHRNHLDLFIDFQMRSSYMYNFIVFHVSKHMYIQYLVVIIKPFMPIYDNVMYYYGYLICTLKKKIRILNILKSN